MNRHITGAGVASLLAFAGAAHAGTIVQSGSLGPNTTNWSQSFQINQFDDLGGTRQLDEVIIDLVGRLEGSAGAENRDEFAKSVTLDMSAMFTISLGSENLVSSYTAISENFSLDAYDGTIDFAGPSGMMFEDMSDTASAQQAYDGLTRDISPWIGDGELTLEAFANAGSFASGGGNITFLFQSQASIDFTISYVHSAAGVIVPTPTALGFGLAGLAGIAGGRRRRN
ncbi:MAG: choice-of-anchor E domain-containing protein [Phycisphaeraceae bacterium]|nr:MAG: choice-of-anchor E domain-containing protein [Phycisphaeraceae bacterium]